jgi:YVTN family beta-propeller protein
MLNQYVRAVAAATLAAAGLAAHAQSVSATIALPNLPEAVAADVANNRVYVAVPNFGEKPYDYVTVINGNNNEILKNIRIPPIAYAITANPLTGEVYVGGSFEDANGILQSQVVAVNTFNNKVSTPIEVSTTSGDGIQGIAANFVTRRVYVANGSNNEIDVINPSTRAVIARIALPAEPAGVAVNPANNEVYAALLDGSVSVINGKTNSVTTTTAVATSEGDIAVDFLTGNVYATNQVFTPNSTVGVLNAAGALTSAITVGNTPIGIDVDSITGKVFVANTQDGTVSVINTKSKNAVSTLAVNGLYVSANFITGKVYVTSPSDPSVTVISER